jgi:hypothetical protein
LVIDSFAKASFNYSFRVESFPLDNLKLNEAIVESNKCNDTRLPTLNCLESKSMKTDIQRCVNNYSLSFSYAIDNLKEFESQKVFIGPKVFTQLININCN